MAEKICINNALSTLLVVTWIASLSVSASDGDLVADYQPVVATSTATFYGKRYEAKSNRVPGFERFIDVFSQIPYAEPPIGELRFARPVPKTIDGDFDATRDPVACSQVKTIMDFDLPFSEDCLLLDVAVPQPKDIQSSNNDQHTVAISSSKIYLDQRGREVKFVTVKGVHKEELSVHQSDRLEPRSVQTGLIKGPNWIEFHIIVGWVEPDKAAVMVWIHGGGYHIGAPRQNMKDTLFLAAKGDIILVSINYRLGVFGFMTTGDESMPGNLGLLDQHLALLWVHENIAAFGGNPNRVTIFGESAGSASVNLHLLSPMSAGLFTGAIMQSGSLAMWTHQPVETNIAITKTFAQEVGCDGTSSVELVECLRGKSVEDLIAVQQNVTYELVRYLVLPVPDGVFLPKDPYVLAAEGAFNRANIISGCLSEEGNMAILPIFHREPISEDAYRGYMPAMMISDPVIQDLMAVLFGSEEMFSRPMSEWDYNDVIAGVTGYSVFQCPTVNQLPLITQAGRTLYTYVMTHRPSHSMWGTKYTGLGPTHGEDIPYIFGGPFMYDEDGDVGRDYNLVGEFEDGEAGLALQMIEYWSNFAKTGDPNLSSVESLPESRYPPWPKYTTSRQEYKEFNLHFENHSGNPFVKECHFLRNILPKLLENTAELEHLKSLLKEKVSQDSGKVCDDQDSCP